MASMTIDTIDGYKLRKDTLLDYLRRLFPEYSRYITTEVRILTWFRIHDSKLAFYLNNTG